MVESRMVLPRPKEVYLLEELLKRPLHPSFDVMGRQNRKCYELDNTGTIVGLNLRHCQLKDGAFLREFPQLRSLDLGFNEIPDGRFLQTLPHLTSLDISNNRVLDWSFLTGLPSLTSLNLET